MYFSWNFDNALHSWTPPLPPTHTHPFTKRDRVFEIFPKSWVHKRGGVGEIGDCSKKGVSLTLTLFKSTFFSVCGVCVLLIYTIFISIVSIVCVSQKGSNRNLISITSKSEHFLKRPLQRTKDLVDLCKVSFSINKLFIQCNTGNCCVPITGFFSIWVLFHEQHDCRGRDTAFL